MFKNTFQSGFLSILYSIGSKPLQIWDETVRNGHIKRITDNDIQSLVLEIVGTNVSTTYIGECCAVTMHIGRKMLHLPIWPLFSLLHLTQTIASFVYFFVTFQILKTNQARWLKPFPNSAKNRPDLTFSSSFDFPIRIELY